jgi:hypothetical protein
MARQAEAERERRAKVISAEGEYQASRRLGQAADVMARHPAALQLRFLQTVVEIAAENNSTTLFPLPVDLFRPFLEQFTGAKAGDFSWSEADEEELDEAEMDALLPEGEEGRRLADAAKERLGIGSGDDTAGAKEELLAAQRRRTGGSRPGPDTE